MIVKKIVVALALLATATSAAFAQRSRDHRAYANRAHQPYYDYAPGYNYGGGGAGGGESGDMGIGSQR